MIGENLSAAELLDILAAHGVTLETKGVTLRTHGTLTPDLRAAVKAHKPELMKLLEPTRTPEPPNCPDHWRHIPVLPAKHETVTPTDEHGNGTRWRVCLFNTWYVLRFKPNVSSTHVEATSQDGQHYSLPSMDSLYRTLWAEAYAPGLCYKEVN